MYRALLLLYYCTYMKGDGWVVGGWMVPLQYYYFPAALLLHCTAVLLYMVGSWVVGGFVRYVGGWVGGCNLPDRRVGPDAWVMDG